MEPILLPTEYAVEDAVENRDEALVHAWRVERLRHLGLPRLLAEMFADAVDWHAVADLVERGCPPLLALEIAR